MKNRALVIILVLGIVALIIGVFLSGRIHPGALTVPQSAPTPYAGVGFRGINLETATVKDITAVMGEPLRKEQGQNEQTLVYPAKTGNTPINVNAGSNNVVLSIVVPADPGTKLSTLTATLGKENVVLYGASYYEGYSLFTYLARGTAVLGNPQTDTVKEQWYFAPTNLAAFLASAAVGFQTNPLPSGKE